LLDLVHAAKAFVQGDVFYLSFWYTYQEITTRSAIFWSTSALAGSFNGFIAYAVQKSLDNQHPSLASVAVDFPRLIHGLVIPRHIHLTLYP
jgi:hypothetical protein